MTIFLCATVLFLPREFYSDSPMLADHQPPRVEANRGFDVLASSGGHDLSFLEADHVCSTYTLECGSSCHDHMPLVLPCREFSAQFPTIEILLGSASAQLH